MTNDSSLGEIPGDWKAVTVGTLLESRVLRKIQDGNHGGDHPKSSDYVDEGVPFVMAKNLKGNRVDFQACKYLTEGHAESLRIGFAKPGDVLLSHKATLGRVAIVPPGWDYVMLSPQVTYYRIQDDSILDNRYLKYVFSSYVFQRQLHASSGQSTRAYLSLTAQEDLELPLPPLSVQRRIADILGALDDKIELNRRMNETLEEMAQILYYRYFDGSVEGADIALEELVEIKPRMPVPDDDEVLTYVGMADVEPNRMSVTDYGKKEYTSGRRFVNHDTLMARITPSLENGKTAFVDFLDDGEMAFGSTEFTVMRAREGTSPCFVYCCARDERFREYAISTMTGSSGRQRVQENLLGEYGFEDFDQSRMDQFHDRAGPLFKLIRSNTSENQTLAETRDYLLPKLISGEIEVDAAEEVAGDTMEEIA